MSPRLSHWEREVLQAPVDIAVIGGGITGLTAAIGARRRFPGRRVALYEREVLSTGAGSRNAGFACFGSPTELLADLDARHESEVLDLIEARWAGLRRLRTLLTDAELHYQPSGGYELFLSDETEVYRRCTELLPWLNGQLRDRIGADVYRTADETLPATGMRGVAHLIHNAYEGLLHPGHLIAGLRRRARAQGVELHLGLDLQHYETAKQGLRLHFAEELTVETAQVLIATNAFAARLLPGIDVRPARNQVLLTTPLPDLRLRGGYHYRDGYVYFRPVGNRLLIGGGRHLDRAGETTTEFGDSPIVQHYLENFLRTHVVPGSPRIERRWSGILGIGHSKSPIVRTVAPGVHVGVRLGGMGVALGSSVGAQLADLLD